jgi:osomolarity two-component system sensor histidine kinase NIK1
MVNCRVGQRLIQKLGHVCDIATSGQQALELFYSHKYDLIFMDVIMPEMDGYTTTKQIREAERKHCLPRTPIIALTAVDSSDKCFDEDMVNINSIRI